MEINPVLFMFIFIGGLSGWVLFFIDEHYYNALYKQYSDYLDKEIEETEKKISKYL